MISKKNPVVFFCMEFGVSEKLPIYAGGLGVLSGDILKGASDVKIPMIGISLLYKFGNFRQKIDENGNQVEFYKEIDLSKLNIKKLPLNLSFKIFEKEVNLTVYELDVSNSKLFLLSSSENNKDEFIKSLTYTLYPSQQERRISQEIILGLGGMMLLKKLGIEPSIYHLNEGHTIFVIVGRLIDLFKKGFSLNNSIKIIRKNTFFTTHTPEIAGNENFNKNFVKKYFDFYFRELDVNVNDLIKMGLRKDDSENFWFSLFAMRFSGKINAVSLLHKKITEKIWEKENVKIDYITNGIHESWISLSFKKLFDKYQKIEMIPDNVLWQTHLENKKVLSDFLKKRFEKEIDPDALIVTYARRIVEYKRPYLLFMDVEKLKNILYDENKPVFILFSGKAHPADKKSKQILKEIFQKIKKFHLEKKVIFLEDYDMEIAKYLVQGSDVWLNTPIVGREASGTSGMKACINGAVHLSTPDGWWYEGFKRTNGFVIEKGKDFKDPQERDRRDAEDLYEKLLIIKEIYYKRNKENIPYEWLKIMKNSIKIVKDNFMIERVLREYEKSYVDLLKAEEI